MKIENLKSYEKISLKLIKEDFRFILTVLNETGNNKKYNYNVAMMPYIGLVIDGANKWGNKIKTLRSSIPVMTNEELSYYEKLRSHIKFFETGVLELNNLLLNKYNGSRDHSYEISNRFCKVMGLFNVYGVFTASINKKVYPLSNTIISSIFIPGFDYRTNNGEYIKEMSVYAGKLAGYYLQEELNSKEGVQLHTVNRQIEFNDYDFGAITKSPYGKKYDSKFLLYCIINACYFSIYGINRYINEPIPMKLRVSYILYYYLNKIIDGLNILFKQNWQLDNSWVDDSIRNALAHYGLWAVLKDNVNLDDLFGGMTNFKFGIHWTDLLQNIEIELINICNMIEKYLLSEGIKHKYIFPINFE